MTTKPLQDLDQRIRRKLRCYQWKQWGHAGYRRLRALGVSRELAWNTANSQKPRGILAALAVQDMRDDAA